MTRRANYSIALKKTSDSDEEHRFVLGIINLLNSFILLSIGYIISATVLFYEIIKLNWKNFLNIIGSIIRRIDKNKL
jgi:hypothetical protein